MNEMPDPVPLGHFCEYRAAICEGFCPACRTPLRPGVRWSGGGYCCYMTGGCKSPDLGRGVCWAYDREHDQIEWTSYGSEVSWRVVVNNLDDHIRA